MFGKDNEKRSERPEIFKWCGWASPVGLGIFIISCAVSILLLALAGSLFIN
ncbi:MAG: hypothetical protein LBH29_07130 [Elusimicrobiota bacterium]|jgi:hypothetical protein|nr:hypothetical protein [Elusimicrobiota bacterium]